MGHPVFRSRLTARVLFRSSHRKRWARLSYNATIHKQASEKGMVKPRGDLL